MNEPHWTIKRAVFALSYSRGMPINVTAYADLFELDMDETVEIFECAAIFLGQVFSMDTKKMQLH